METIQPYLRQAWTLAAPYVHHLDGCLDQVRQKYPIKDNFRFFLELNIFLFVFCWFLAKMRDLELGKIFNIQNLKVAGFRFAVKYIPAVRDKFNGELAKIKPAIQNSFPENCRSKLVKLPKRPIPVPELGNESEKESLKGFLSGSRYPKKQHSDFVASLSARFIYANPLHFHIHPFVRQMEIEVIKMCSKMLNFTDNGEPVGVLLSGGTESIMMAILAAREYGRSKGITKPNLLVCETGHVAALKACQYFEIEARIVKYDANYEMSISDIKSKMDQNTVMVYTSYPNYPYGTVDPIDTIASYCSKRGVLVHVDMCLGGFLVPFLKNSKGQPLFTIPKGVTSISLDPHKYGLSGKGVSILLYSSAQIRSHQFFVISTWPGGLYGTVGIQGSRSGVAIASAWISMLKMGTKGYKESAEKVQQATIKFANALRELGFNVFGNPEICTIGFQHKSFSTNSVQQFMKKKGWGLSVMQRPISLHYSFTPLNATKSQQLIKDIKQCVAYLSKNPGESKNSDELELYGACAQIPDGAAKGFLMSTIVDAFIDI